MNTATPSSLLSLCPIRTPNRDCAYGEVETLAPQSHPEDLSARAIDDGWQSHVWRPSPTLAKELPEGFTFCMRSCRDTTGLRTFFPADEGKFLDVAYSGGMAYRMRHWGLTPDERFERRRRWLLFAKSMRMNEHLENLFLHPCSLGGGGVLRSSLESDVTAEWVSVASLLAEGREEAKVSGLERPPQARLIALGLYRIARRNPLLLDTPEAVEMVVRSALYDLPGSAPPGIVQPVAQKLWKMIDDWLDLDDEDFGAKFFGSGNNLIAYLQNLKRQCPAGDLTIAAVRRVILDESWRAALWVGECVGDMLARFADALPDSLTTAERRLYDEMYLPRNYLAGLPLPLLLKRQAVVAAALPDVWRDPANPEALGVLYRLLWLYRELALNRRITDNSVKTTSLPADSVLGGERIVPLSSSTGGGNTESSDWAVAGLQRIGETFRIERGVSCGCDIPTWEQSYSTTKSEEQLFFFYTCAKCGKSVKEPVSWEEIRDLFPDGP
jgi:hypothetical protein